MKISDALEVFKTKANLARALGVSRQAVTKWGEEVPLVRQYQLHVLTGGRLKAERRVA